MRYSSITEIRFRRLRCAAAVLVVCWAMWSSTSVEISGFRQQQASTADPLAAAARAYGLNEFANAEANCTIIIDLLSGKTGLEPVQQSQLLDAYALRARARSAMRQIDRMREDLRALLALSPSYDLGPVNPNVDAAFKALRSEMYGQLSIRVNPPDAEVRIDNGLIDASKGPIVVGVGPRNVSVTKPGFQTITETVTVKANAPPLEFSRDLDRISSTLMFITVPADVEVWISGVQAGSTKTGTLPAEWAAAAREDLNALGPLASSAGYLQVENVSAGEKTVEYRRDCYETETRYKMTIGDPRHGNFFVKPVKLVSNGAPLTVTGLSGRVLIDSEDRGPVPYSGVLCPRATPYSVELTTDRGHFLERVTPQTGRPINIKAEPKPALAILKVTGLPEGFRSDLRRELENALSQASSVAVFAPAPDRVQRELDRERLQDDWLSFDTAGRPLSERAFAISEPDRRLLSASLSNRLGAQGVVQITVPFKQNPWTAFVTILAAGGSLPDTIEVRINDPEAIGRIIARLNTTPPLIKVSAGIQVADALDAGGAVVVRHFWKTSETVLQRGDIIRTADGIRIEDGSAFLRLVSTKRAADKLRVEVNRTDGTSPNVELTLLALPEVIGLYDQSLLPNTLVLKFRETAVKLVGQPEESIARLNLGVALMRTGNWLEAVTELSKVRLADGPGVSSGTVQFLLGVCYEALLRFQDAMAAFGAAAASDRALLTNDGPEIKLLADEKMADLQRRNR